MKLFEKINYNVAVPMKELKILKTRIHPHMEMKVSEGSQVIRTYYRGMPIVEVDIKEKVLIIQTDKEFLNILNDILWVMNTCREVIDGELVSQAVERN